MDNEKEIHLASKSNEQVKELDPLKLLSFARGILITIVVVWLLASGSLLAFNDSKAAELIFEKADNFLPPLVTLVLGFYFGGRHGR